MNIAVVGLGYVGLPTALWLAEQGHCVYGYDLPIVEAQIEKLVHLSTEPNVTELLGKHLGNAFRLGVKHTHVDLLFVAIYDNASDDQFDHLISVIRQIDETNVTYDGVVIKSTLAVNVTDLLSGYFAQRNIPWCVNPEFLRQGFAYEDTSAPSRVVVGGDDKAFNDKVISVLPKNAPVFLTDPNSACISKLMANSILATKAAMSLMIANTINQHNINASMVDIAQIVGADPRIGNSHLLPGLGVGGACLPKDLELLAKLTHCGPVNNFIGKISDFVNEFQGDYVLSGMTPVWSRIPKGMTVLVIGSGFKPGVTDSRTSPVMSICDSRPNVVVVEPSEPPQHSLISWLSCIPIAVVLNTRDYLGVQPYIDIPSIMYVFDPHNFTTSMEWKLLFGNKEFEVFTNGVK